jgi:hypothetical protein
MILPYASTTLRRNSAAQTVRPHPVGVEPCGIWWAFLRREPPETFHPTVTVVPVRTSHSFVQCDINAMKHTESIIVWLALRIKGCNYTSPVRTTPDALSWANKTCFVAIRIQTRTNVGYFGSYHSNLQNGDMDNPFCDASERVAMRQEINCSPATTGAALCHAWHHRLGKPPRDNWELDFLGRGRLMFPG